MAALGSRIVEEAAAVGDCVIVGRGAQCLLRGRSDAFHVFVYAPPEERLRRLRARLGSGADVDSGGRGGRQRAGGFHRRYFGEDRWNPHLYHMMVNGALGEEAAVSVILTALETGALVPA